MVLEYSVTVNGFIESEALTPLKAAEHPRIKSTQSSAAFAVCLCVSERESTCCSREAQIQYRHQYKPALCLCSASLTRLMSLGLFMPDLLCVTTNQWHFSITDIYFWMSKYLSCFSNQPKHHTRPIQDIICRPASPLFGLSRKQDIHTEESGPADHRARTERVGDSVLLKKKKTEQKCRFLFYILIISFKVTSQVQNLLSVCLKIQLTTNNTSTHVDMSTDQLPANTQ